MAASVVPPGPWVSKPGFSTRLPFAGGVFVKVGVDVGVGGALVNVWITS